MMTAQEKRIVVGVDGSESSKAALRWAIHQARLIGGSVDAVTAWWYPATYGLASAGDEGTDFEGDARTALTVALNEVSGLDPDVPVHPLVMVTPVPVETKGWSGGTLVPGHGPAHPVK
jgi:nucleotide-binding universal stress UspA family protein